MLSNLSSLMYKPENCGVLSHHSNNKTNVLPTFQVHSLLLARCQRLLFMKDVAKIKNVKKLFLF